MVNRRIRLAALSLALLTPLALAQDAEPKQDEPTPKEAPEATPAEAPTEPKIIEPELPPGLDPKTAEKIREARRRAAELRDQRPAPAAGAPTPGVGPQLSDEMRERLKAAGIDPDSVGGSRGAGSAGMPGMPSGANMPNMSGMGTAGAIGAARPGAGVGAGMGAGTAADPTSRLNPPGPPPTDSTVPNMTPGTRAPEPPEAPPISREDANAVLERLVGAWDVSIRLYEQGRPTPATQGKSTFGRVASDTFVRETFAGAYGNQPVEGVGYTGFDEATQRFTMAWLDSTSGAIATAKGTYDPDMETLNFAGQYDAAKPPLETRTTITLGQTDKHVFTFKLVQPNGAELTVYELIYKRASE